MDRLAHTTETAYRRKERVRSKIHGTKDCPRLSVNISLNHISAQLIDDDRGVTLGYITSVAAKHDGTMSEKAAVIGKEIAKKAKAKKINKVVFDRGAKLYHGRVKALADAARAEGLEF